MSPLPFILMTALCWNNPADSDGMVLEFSATWCGPCQQISPMVSRLERQGYPIQKVDVNQQEALARQYGIQTIPTCVLVVRGQEITRIGGREITEDSLMQLFARIPKKTTVVKAKTHAVVRGNISSEPAPIKRLDISGTMASSTRIRIRDSKGDAYGSGTIIDSRPGNTIVLTCGHIFRDLDKTSVIEVDVFTDGKPDTFVGKLLKFDLEAEVGLISIASDNVLPASRVAAAGYKAQKTQQVESIGCGDGKNPTSYKIEITALNKYLGPDNIECKGIPVQGRSGGGLFDKDGFVIGVCMAADHKGNRGLYSGLQPIHDLLEKCELARLYRSEGELATTKLASVKSAAKIASDAKTVPADDDTKFDPAILEGALAADAPLPAVGEKMESARIASLNSSDASVDETAKEALSDGAEAAEVVCVIRPIRNPRGASKVVVINRASSKFMNYLTDELQTQSQVKPTSYPVRTASISEPPVRSTPGAYRRSRALSW